MWEWDVLPLTERSTESTLSGEGHWCREEKPDSTSITTDCGKGGA